MSNPLLKDVFACATDIVARASAEKLSIGTAESCTGGLIGGALTAISGSSACYKGGVIAYSNALKQSLLGVSETSLCRHGAVSEIVAKEMALGAITRLQVDLAVSVTGIAGPGGAVEGKPVGTVWFGLAMKGQEPQAFHHAFGDIGRNRVRDQAVLEGLKLIQNALPEQS